MKSIEIDKQDTTHGTVIKGLILRIVINTLLIYWLNWSLQSFSKHNYHPCDMC